MITIDIPKYGDDFYEHSDTLYFWCAALRAKSILELGVRNGVSTAALLTYAAANNTTVTSVDIVVPENGIINHVDKNN